MPKQGGNESSNGAPGVFTPEVKNDLASSLYRELHRLAARKMSLERPGHTLQPTALVNEAYLRLADLSGAEKRDRVHFLATAARVMRHVLVDHARTRNAAKRGEGAIHLTFDDVQPSGKERGRDILALDDALQSLSAFDPRQALILELHFFSGMTFEEIALLLDSSPRTIKREWTMARAWLKAALSKRK